MIYFFLAPLWLLAVVAGLVLLAVRPVRRVGAIVICSSTLGILLSFVASTATFFIYGGAVGGLGLESNGLVLVGGYLLAAAAGGLLGLVLGLLLALRLTRPKPVAA